MAKAAESSDVKFIVNTGDNFYWCGIENTSDFQVQKDWVEPYSDKSLQVPWYGVLGNHEYGYNVSAQIELGKVYKTWVMDARYYTRRLHMSGSNFVSRNTALTITDTGILVETCTLLAHCLEARTSSRANVISMIILCRKIVVHSLFGSRRLWQRCQRMIGSLLLVTLP